MSSTFYGLTIGATGLNASSASVNTVANNVSNANTKGYSRQITNLEAAGYLRNYNYGTLGGGVRAVSVTQMRNNYYDIKYWTNHADAGQYEKKIYYTEQIESVFTDFAATKGFSTIYNTMFNSLESLKGDGANDNIRNQFIHNAQSLMDYFNNVSSSLRSVQSDCNQEVKALISQINTTSKKISVLNDKINTLEIHGTYANELRDERALLIDELSSMIGVEIEETPVTNSNYPEMYTGATLYRVRVAGQLLIDGSSYNELEVYSREEKVNQNDIDGLYDIRWSSTGNDFNAAADTMSGQLKAILDIRDGNNKENFQGVLDSYQGHIVTIKNPNITRIDAMNMPPEGYLMIGSKQYKYTDFTMITELDKTNGKETCTYKFTLDTQDMGTLGGCIGKPVSVGTSVDARGIPYYQTQMNEFLRSFSRMMNNIQQYGSVEKGQDTTKYGVTEDGRPMGAFIIADRPDGSENTFEDYEGTVTERARSKTTVYKSTENNYYYLTAQMWQSMI